MRKTEYGFVVDPTIEHTHTVVVLHSHCQGEDGRMLLQLFNNAAAQGARSINIWRLYPNWKWVFVFGPWKMLDKLRNPAQPNGKRVWCDVSGGIQYEGICLSFNRVLSVLDQEAQIVTQSHLIVMGFGAGCIMGILGLKRNNMGIGAFVGSHGRTASGIGVKFLLETTGQSASEPQQTDLNAIGRTTERAGMSLNDILASIRPIMRPGQPSFRDTPVRLYDYANFGGLPYCQEHTLTMGDLLGASVSYGDILRLFSSVDYDDIDWIMTDPERMVRWLNWLNGKFGYPELGWGPLVYNCLGRRY